MSLPLIFVQLERRVLMEFLPIVLLDHTVPRSVLSLVPLADLERLNPNPDKMTALDVKQENTRVCLANPIVLTVQQVSFRPVMERLFVPCVPILSAPSMVIRIVRNRIVRLDFMMMDNRSVNFAMMVKIIASKTAGCWCWIT